MQEQIQVIHEDNHLIAVNKPGGWLVQGDQTGDTPLSEYVKFYIKNRYNKPGDVFLGIIHRLDRPVSGVVTFARTSKGLTRMNKLFQDRLVQKTYLAVVTARPAEVEGKLIHYLTKDHERNITLASRKQRYKKSKKAELDYKLLGSIGNNHLLKITPHTGRPHQIRVQLSQLGCPIRGDLKYGAPKANYDATIHLHGHSLSFIHPVKKEKVIITAPPPNDQVWQLFDGLIEN